MIKLVIKRKDLEVCAVLREGEREAFKAFRGVEGGMVSQENLCG